jgi:hypothetical protein
VKTIVKKGKDGEVTMMRHGRNIADMDRSFDIEYWQRQGDAAIFNAAWELVEFYLRQQGIHDTTLQRTVEHFQRERS